MSRPYARKKKIAVFELISFTIIALLLLFTSLNIAQYLKPKKVLGISVKPNTEEINNQFWNEFLKENPDYIPGWIEIGRIDKAIQIDPNYEARP